MGELIILELDESPTTGYRWHTTVSPAGVLELEDDTFNAPPSGRVGAAGQRILTFRAVDPGTAQVRGIRRRSWEGATGEPDAPLLTVHVSDRRP